MVIFMWNIFNSFSQANGKLLWLHELQTKWFLLLNNSYIFFVQYNILFNTFFKNIFNKIYLMKIFFYTLSYKIFIFFSVKVKLFFFQGLMQNFFCSHIWPRKYFFSKKTIPPPDYQMVAALWMRLMTCYPAIPLKFHS